MMFVAAICHLLREFHDAAQVSVKRLQLRLLLPRLLVCRFAHGLAMPIRLVARASHCSHWLSLPIS
jgi:hypothetical protein